MRKADNPKGVYFEAMTLLIYLKNKNNMTETKKYKILSDENKEKRKNLKFFKILNDEIFWIKYQKVSNYYRITKLREYRTKLLIPAPKFLDNFINDYKLIQKDNRENQEILLDLLSEDIEETQKEEI